jgi:hypothetical protein
VTLKGDLTGLGQAWDLIGSEESDPWSELMPLFRSDPIAPHNCWYLTGKWSRLSWPNDRQAGVSWPVTSIPRPTKTQESEFFVQLSRVVRSIDVHLSSKTWVRWAYLYAFSVSSHLLGDITSSYLATLCTRRVWTCNVLFIDMFTKQFKSDHLRSTRSDSLLRKWQLSRLKFRLCLASAIGASRR